MRSTDRLDCFKQFLNFFELFLSEELRGLTVFQAIDDLGSREVANLDVNIGNAGYQRKMSFRTLDDLFIESAVSR